MAEGNFFKAENDLVDRLWLDIKVATDTLSILIEHEIYTIGQFEALNRATLSAWGIRNEEIDLIERTEYGRNTEVRNDPPD